MVMSPRVTWPTLLVLGILLLVIVVTSQPQNLPFSFTVAEEVGLRTVVLVEDWIYSLRIFRYDSYFFRRLACVDTGLGLYPYTFRTGYYGGIWQVEEYMFLRTLDVVTYPCLTQFHTSLSIHGIVWSSVTWQHLRIAPYSAIAARLYYECVVIVVIPTTVILQVTFYINIWYQGRVPRGGFYRRVGDGKGDPHISQVVRGSTKHLCYEVNDQSGTFYKVLDDEVLGVKAAFNMVQHQSDGTDLGVFMDEVVVFVNDTLLTIDTTSITDNNALSLDWASSTVVNVTKDLEVTVDASQGTTQLNIHQLLWITVKRYVRRHTFFNIEVSVIGELSANATGLLGDVANHVVIDETVSPVTLNLTLDNGFSDVVNIKSDSSCWHVPTGLSKYSQILDQFTSMLKQSKISCLTCWNSVVP